jgi:hypothetical protein
VYEAVDATSNAERAARMASLPSTRAYAQKKEWGVNMSQSDRGDLKGTRLKMLCSMGCLPVMDRVGREARRWPKEARTCLECPAYAGHRARMVDGVLDGCWVRSSSRHNGYVIDM